MHDAVFGVFPALVRQPSLRTQSVGEKLTAVLAQVFLHPKEGTFDVRHELRDECGIAGPRVIFRGEEKEPRRRVDGAVVWRHRDLAEVCHLAPPQLVQDFSRFLVAKVVSLLPLIARQKLEGRPRELWLECEQLVSANEAVASEQRGIPGNTSGDVRIGLVRGRQHPHIVERAGDRSIERLVRCLDRCHGG